MGGLFPEILALPALALAAGVDLYLVLLLLGAAPTLGLWGPLPGALQDLDSVGVLILVGAFYVAEFAAERTPAGALVWNVFHALIRPVAGGLLALLLLAGHPPQVALPGAVVAAVLASAAHATATGGSFLLWLSGRARPHPLLVSVAEDVAVLGLVALALDFPAGSAAVAALACLAALPVAGSQIRAFRFTIRLARGSVAGFLARPAWTEARDVPSRVRRALAGDEGPPGAIRGTAAAALHLPDAPRFVLGWLVERGGAPLLVHGRRPPAVDLSPFPTDGVSEAGFFRRVDLGRAPGRPVRLYVPLDGPPLEGLEVLFAPRSPDGTGWPADG